MEKDTVTVIGGQVALVFGHVRSQNVLHQHLEAQLFLGAKFLEDRTRFRTSFEITCENNKNTLFILLNVYTYKGMVFIKGFNIICKGNSILLF